MRPIEAVLKLRPSNVAQRLPPGSRACVLNPRDLLRALEGRETVVLCCEISLPRAFTAGILEAARSLGAVVGLSSTLHAQGEGPTPYAVFQELTTAAAATWSELPLFLRSGPIAVSSVDERALDAAREIVFKHVDAGFTSICVAPSGLTSDQVALAVADITAPARERELSVELVLQASDEIQVWSQLKALRARGVSPDVIVVPSGAASSAKSLLAMYDAAKPSVLAFTDGPIAPPLAKVGVRRANVVGAFARLAERRLPAELADRVRARASETNTDFAQALGMFHREVAALAEPERERLEAFAYHEAVELLTAAGAQGTAKAALEFLAEKSGY